MASTEDQAAQCFRSRHQHLLHCFECCRKSGRSMSGFALPAYGTAVVADELLCLPLFLARIHAVPCSAYLNVAMSVRRTGGKAKGGISAEAVVELAARTTMPLVSHLLPFPLFLLCLMLQSIPCEAQSPASDDQPFGEPFPSCHFLVTSQVVLILFVGCASVACYAACTRFLLSLSLDVMGRNGIRCGSISLLLSDTCSSVRLMNRGLMSILFHGFAKSFRRSRLPALHMSHGYAKRKVLFLLSALSSNFCVCIEREREREPGYERHQLVNQSPPFLSPAAHKSAR